MKSRIAALFLAYSLACTTAFAQSTSYSMNDLEALAKSESWEELLAHGKDIRPAARDAKWEALIETSAIEYFGKFTAKDYKDTWSGPMRQVDSLPKSYPHLKKSAAFREKRAEVAARAYKACRYGARWCARSEREWFDVMRDFVKNNEGDAVIPFELGKMIQENHVPYASTWFFAQAVKVEPRKAWCNDGTVKKAIESSKKDNYATASAEEIEAACQKAT